MIYLFPTLGADRRMYPGPWSNLKPHSFIEWPTYAGETSIHALASRNIADHRITPDDPLVGSSLGEIVACEIAELTSMAGLGWRDDGPDYAECSELHKPDVEEAKKGTYMKDAETKKELPPEQRDELLKTLKARFENNMNRHKGLEWAKVRTRLEANVEKLWSLNEMERTGGEPDVVGHDKKTGEYNFFDCSAESPKGRTSLCYDREALESRKEHKPKNSATDMAAAMCVELLREEQYQELQKLGAVDTKSSSWVETPPDMRKLGGALFGDRRFGRVFFYHNGAESYYSGRGFRGSLRV